MPGTYYVPDTYVPGISRQTNVPPVDAHVWRQLHVSAAARCSDSYYSCIFFSTSTNVSFVVTSTIYIYIFLIHRTRISPLPPLFHRNEFWLLLCRGDTRHFVYFIKSWKNVSCEYDRLNGWNSTLQAAWYIRHVRIVCFLVNYTYDMIINTQVIHKTSSARVLCFILMKDIGRWLPWMLPIFVKLIY